MKALERQSKPKKKNKQAEALIKAIDEGTGAIATPEAIEGVDSLIQDIIYSEDNTVFKASPGPQTNFLAAPEREVLYGGAKGGGKLSNINDLVVTPTGFKKLGDIKDNDLVITGTGKITKVLKAHEIVEEEAYDVTFSTGEVIKAHADHLWKVYDAKQRVKLTRLTPEFREKRKANRKSRAKEDNLKPWASKNITETNKTREYSYLDTPKELVVSTQEIRDNLYVGKGQARTVNFSVENCLPVEFTEKVLPIAPYIFGLWLGDGNSNSGIISMMATDVDEVLNYCGPVTSVKLLQRPNRLDMKKIKFCKNEDLRNIGVLDNKHIPNEYLRGSIEQRLELLQGIMDTDGHARIEKGQCEITLKSEKLLNDVQELVSSLGIKSTVHTKLARSQTGYTCIVYRITFYSKLPVFKLKRKLKCQKQTNFSPTVFRRFITSVVPSGKCKMRCLTVKDEDHTFLLGRTFIKTHNSYALLIDPLRYCHSRHSRALIIRRSTPDLRDMVAKAQHLYPKAYPGVKWSSQQNMFTFPSGARVEFTFCENQSDLPRFQGINMTYCGIDEAASHPYLPELLNYVRSNIRSVDPIEVPPMLRMTANPGEVMSHYLRTEFVERAMPNTTFWDHVKIFDPRTKDTRIVNISKKYIPATIFDNPYLLKDDSYLATLASLPETKRKQWLEGNWFVSEMSAFPEFDINMHVVKPFQIPKDCKKLKGADWGFTSPGCAYWGAVLPSGQLVIYREFVFQKKDALRVATEGRALEIGEGRSVGILDASSWQQRGTLGQSVGEIFQNTWPSWVPSSRARVANNSSRIHRKNLVHNHLAINPATGEPRMVIFPNCRKLIEALSGLPIDKNDPEKADTDSPLDHFFDAVSYLLQGRPTQLRSWVDPFDRKAEKAYQVQDQAFGY